MKNYTFNLSIGILESEPGWIILLKQLGVFYQKIERFDSITPGTCGVLIVNRTLSTVEVKVIEQYLRQGGAVLDTGYFLETALNRRFQIKRFKTIFPESRDIPFRDIELIDLYSTARTLNTAQYFKKTIYFDRPGGGFLAFMGIDINRALTDTRHSRKQFYSPNGYFPNEIVAKVSKGEIVKAVRSVLQWLFFQRGLPYLHLWYFPGQQKNIFVFRIDSDSGTQAQVKKFYEIAQKHDIKMTWFLHGEAHENWLSFFRSFENQEFAVHGYKHHTFGSVEKNHTNILNGKYLLEREGLQFEGFAAPYGSWNVALARAVEKLNFNYASEFSLDYDNLPFFPWLNSRFSSVLQIPIHPVCIGSFARTKASEDDMKKYFRYVIDKKLSANEPLIFYDHLLHEQPAVLEDIFRYTRELQIKNLTFGEYARWWKLRETSGFKAFWENGKLRVDFGNISSSIFLCVQHSPQQRGFIQNSGEYCPDEFSWQTIPSSPAKLPENIARVRKFNPKLIQYSLLDAYWRARP
jgi:hypothetical protein